MKELIVNISSFDFVFFDEVVSGIGDEVSLVFEIEVLEYYSSREYESDRVGFVGVYDVFIDVLVFRFEEGVFL